MAGERAGGVGVGEVIDLHAIEPDLEPLALHQQLEGVPLARWVERRVPGSRVRGLDGVDRASRAVRRVGGVDLDLIAVVQCRRRVARRWEAHDHAGVVVTGHLPVQLQRVVRELPGAVPEHAHAAVRGEGGVRVGEAARAGLRPAGGRAVVEGRIAGLGPAVGLGPACRVPDAAEQVRPERRLRVRRLAVPAAGVEGPAPRVALAPRVRVVGAHRAARVRRLVQRGEHARGGTGVGPEVVPLIGAGPSLRQVGGRRVRPPLHLDVGLLDSGVRGEVGADQVAVERPVVLRVRGRVDADEAAARSDVRLERRLLGLVQNVAGGVEEDHRLVTAQVGGGEVVAVLRGRHRETVGGAEVADGLDPCRDRVVPESGRLGEHEDVVGRVRGIDGAGLPEEGQGGECRGRPAEQASGLSAHVRRSLPG